jgi:pimeloyl-ACP methyl ester carboxylesterase
VFWHGGGLTGACWETTPDGRPGWLHYFLRRGWDAYLCDAVERGRSGFAPVPDVWPTPVSQTAEDVFKRFRIGTPAHGESLDSLADGAYPNGCFPVESFGALVRQLVPRWTHTDDVIFRGYLSLLDRADPCVLVCHSQGGMFGLRAAMVRPDRVKAVVALEPASVPPPEEWPADYRVPTLILLGDNIESDARWPAIRNKIAAFAARYPCVKLISLPSVGLSGNSHMLMMDKNSLEIADLAHDWLEGNLAGAESGKS